MNHVVDRGALLRLLVRRANVEPGLVGCHLGAALTGADAEQLND